MKTKSVIILSIILLTLGLLGGTELDRLNKDGLFNFSFNGVFQPKEKEETEEKTYSYIEGNTVKEESLIIDVVEKTSPSVVTVSIKKTQRVLKNNQFGNLFDPFGFFGYGGQAPEVEEKSIERDIGTGFVISQDGLVVTNKHVVSDAQAEYKIISNDDKEYEVEKIYRDTSLDLAILKVKDLDIKPLTLGDSDQLKVGQSVIAIGTALGEFRNTVTTGVVSGLSRGINAGNPYGSYSEQLENVIQTDAAINPGNSGGPLLNSVGQVIGINVATAGGADNISFAIPINIIKNSIDNFNQTGQFQRAFLGVQYKMISKDLAIMNEIPEGAYLVSVVEGSAAEKGGLQKGDIITKMDKQSVTEGGGGLAKLISQHKVGDRIEIEYWRDGENKITVLTLGENDQGKKEE